MKYNPAIHNRRSIRLKTYDYSKAGLYFITFCVQNTELLFGEIENNVMILNDAGKMIYAEWEKLPERFTNIQLHEFVVMPNHFHGIIEIAGAPLVVAQNAHPGETKNDEEVSAGAPLVVAQNAHPGETKNDEEVPAGAPIVGAQNAHPGKTKNDEEVSVGAPLVGAQNSHPGETKNNEEIIVGTPLVGAHNTRKDNDGAIESNNQPINDSSRSPAGAPTRGAPTDTETPTNNTLGEMMGAFKSITTVEYIKGVKNSGCSRSMASYGNGIILSILSGIRRLTKKLLITSSTIHPDGKKISFTENKFACSP
jgi:hypothetical protein